MKKSLGVAAVLLLAALVFCLLFHSKKTASMLVAPSLPNPSVASTVSPTPLPLPSFNSGIRPLNSSLPQAQTTSGTRAAQESEIAPGTSSTPALPPETVLNNVRHMVHQYGEMFGGNPVGTNPEITSQLRGNNPRHINFIDEQAGMKIDAEGQLVDAWGTPYFFHQISGVEMEIHSAGPDKIMWTSDDLVAK